MRLVKLLAFPAIIAFASMGLVVPSLASATFTTTLCTEDTADLLCPEGKRANHVHFEADLAKLLNNLQTVECDALFLGETVGGASGSPLVIEGRLTYICHDNCEVNGAELPEEKEEPHALINVLKTAPNLAEITGSGEVFVSCGAVIRCKYIGTGLVGHGTSALEEADPTPDNNGHVTFNATPVTKLPNSGQPLEGILCPPSATLDALFKSLTPLYVRSSQSAPEPSTTLCTEDTADLLCPPVKRAKHVHFEADLAKLLNPIQDVECDALFLGETVGGASGSPLVIKGKLTYTCHSGCEADGAELPEEVEEKEEHALISVLKTGPEEVDVAVESEVLVRCPGLIHCKYIGTGLVGHGLGATESNNGHITFNDTPVARLPDAGQPVKGFLCPTTASLDALFESLTPLWIRS